MPKVARFGDTTTTGHGCDGTTTVVGGSSNVFCNGKKVERKGDPTAPHTILSGAVCVPHSANINVGSKNVYVNGKQMAKVGDSTDAGEIISGSSNVFVN